MVNTFFIHTDVYTSAKSLDYFYLNKQTYDAVTIYRNIFNIKLLAAYYSKAIPKDPCEVYSWIRDIVKIYKKENCIFLFRENGELIKLPHGSKMIQQNYNQKIVEIKENKVILKCNKGIVSTINIDSFIGLNDHIVNFEYIYHPTILLWFNYLPALKHYINVHVTECKVRGYENHINIYSKEYSNEITPEYPPWTKDEDFITRHKSNLIRKMPGYYAKMFTDVKDDMQYLCPYTPEIVDENDGSININIK